MTTVNTTFSRYPDETWENTIIFYNPAFDYLFHFVGLALQTIRTTRIQTTAINDER